MIHKEKRQLIKDFAVMHMIFTFLNSNKPIRDKNAASLYNKCVKLIKHFELQIDAIQCNRVKKASQKSGLYVKAVELSNNVRMNISDILEYNQFNEHAHHYELVITLYALHQNGLDMLLSNQSRFDNTTIKVPEHDYKSSHKLALLLVYELNKRIDKVYKEYCKVIYPDDCVELHMTNNIHCPHHTLEISNTYQHLNTSRTPKIRYTRNPLMHRNSVAIVKEYHTCYANSDTLITMAYCIAASKIAVFSKYDSLELKDQGSYNATLPISKKLNKYIDKQMNILLSLTDRIHEKLQLPSYEKLLVHTLSDYFIDKFVDSEVLKHGIITEIYFFQMMQYYFIEHSACTSTVFQEFYAYDYDGFFTNIEDIDAHDFMLYANSIAYIVQDFFVKRPSQGALAHLIH